MRDWNIQVRLGAWGASVPIKAATAKEAHQSALSQLNLIASDKQHLKSMDNILESPVSFVTIDHEGGEHIATVRCGHDFKERLTLALVEHFDEDVTVLDYSELYRSEGQIPVKIGDDETELTVTQTWVY